MNKLKASKVEMKRYDKILGVGGAGLQHLLRGVNPIAYSSDFYGWACDYYYIDGVLISMGYQPIKTKGVSNDYALIKEYDNKARLINDNGKSYEQRINAINILLSEFIQVVKGGK